MVNSMTGFGRGEAPYGDGAATVEITTVNGRYLDVHVRGLREYGALELKVRARVAEVLARGTVHVNVKLHGASPGQKRVVADVELAREFERAFERLRTSLGLAGGLPLEVLATRPEFLAIEERPGDDDAFGASILEGLEHALAAVRKMRAYEGAKLQANLRMKLEQLEELFDAIAARAPAIITSYRERVRTRTAELTDAVTIEKGRLEAEVALFAERCDINEEIARSRAHGDAFAAALEEDGRIGRRLDFLTVEMNREANTVAAKAQDAAVSTAIVKIKDLLEQLREQVQNVE